jgi:hypothetical protein
MTNTYRPPWIDPRLRELPPRPWRKIHLDYHNSEHMPRLGQRFDPDAFGATLQAGHVDSIVVFAKDMHGYFYYPTERGPIHGGLGFDMLAGQVKACRERNIKVYAYYCVTWDNYLAERRPEWLVWKRDRTTYLPAFDQPPGWTALCLTNEDFIQQVLFHSREILEGYELDGIWYDMPLPIGGECFCRNCLKALRDAGADPFDRTAQRRHKQQVLADFMRRAHELAHQLRPGCQVDQNNQTRLGLRERAPHMDNIDIEALPTAFWGYLYYPTNVRYARTFGRSVCGMSGRFHRSWADFGGLKHPNQLRTELRGIVAHAAQADLGDQLPPDGRLDPAVYHTIGQAYAEIEQLEPWLERAVPVVEAAIVVRGLPLEDLATTNAANHGPTGLGTAVYGLTKLLMECQIQFDIVEVTDDLPPAEVDALLGRYRLLALPDTLEVTEGLARQLRAYLANGGALIGAHTALRVAGTDTIWAEELGVAYRGESPFAPSYLKLVNHEEQSTQDGAGLWEGLPDYEYALYNGAAQWLPSQGAVVVARLGVPLFQRGGQHYTSHAQTPFDRLTDYAAAVSGGRVVGMAFPVATSYYQHGYWIYREVFRRLLRQVLPEPLVATNAPISAEVTLTHQTAGVGHSERWMVHIVNFSPNRRSPEHCEYLEDPIPLHDITVRLRLEGPFARAYVAGDDTPLVLTHAGDTWQVVVPKAVHGAIVVFER